MGKNMRLVPRLMPVQVILCPSSACSALLNVILRKRLEFELPNVEGIEMSGRPDEMIATGYREPKKPFFCFQEQDAEGDVSVAI